MTRQTLRGAEDRTDIGLWKKLAHVYVMHLRCSALLCAGVVSLVLCFFLCSYAGFVSCALVCSGSQAHVLSSWADVVVSRHSCRAAHVLLCFRCCCRAADLLGLAMCRTVRVLLFVACRACHAGHVLVGSCRVALVCSWGRVLSLTCSWSNNTWFCI